tara:strand:+ start:2142 stop:3575 length:1434 start_codon:yes stop_codon:yes gene_type:complete
MVNYVNRISTLAQDPAAGATDGLIDETDKIHTGIVKALEARSQGNYVISMGTLAQTDGGSNTTFTINGGTTNLVYKRNGKVITISSNKTVNLTNKSSSDRYDMLVITDDSGTLAIRAGTLSGTSALVPELTLGDVPVALIQVLAASDNDVTNRHIQFFGTDKREDEITIAWNNSEVYTKTATISASANTATIAAESGADVKVKLAGTAAGDTFEVIDSASQVQFKVQGDGAVSVPNGTFTAGTVTAGTTVVQSSDSTTNAVVLPFKISEVTSGTPAVGLGVGMQYEVETSAGNNEIGAITDAQVTNVSSGSETFKWNLSVMNGGSLVTYLTVESGMFSHPSSAAFSQPYLNLPDDSLQSDADANNASLQFGRFQLPDVQAASDNFINLPPLSGVYDGQMITVKNITTNDLIIKGAGSDTIDYGSTANAMISSGNTVTLGSAMAITFQSVKAIATVAYTNAIAAGPEVSTWIVVSQTA